MPSIEWIFGGNQRERDQHLLGLLSQTLAENTRFPDFWILTLSKRRSRFLTDAWKKSNPQGFWKPQIFLFDEWVSHLFQHLMTLGLIPGSPRSLRDAEENVCIESALLHLRSQLTYFSKVFTTPKDLKYLPGLVAGLKEIFKFLKSNAIKTDLVDRIILNDQGESNAKDHDLTLLFHHVENLLDSLGLIDQEDKAYLLLDQPINIFPKSFFPGTLVIDHPSFFSQIEEKLLIHLLPCFSKVVIAVDFPREPTQLLNELARNQHRYFSGMKGTLKCLLESPHCQHAFVRISPDSKSGELCRRAVHSHHHRTAEVEWMCREIKSLALSGVALSDVHVSFPRIDSYLSIIYEIFPQYGIPFSITRGLALDSSPLAIVIRSILKIPQEYSRESIYRFFSSSLVTFRERFSETQFLEFVRHTKIGTLSSVMNEEEIVQRFTSYVEEQQKQQVDGFHFDVASLDRYARSANISGGADVINDWFIPLDRVYFRARMRAQGMDVEGLEDLKRRYFLILRQIYLLSRAKHHFDHFLKATNGKDVLDLLRYYVRFFGIERNLVSRLENLPLLSERDRYFLLRRDMQSLDSVLGVLDDVMFAIKMSEDLKQDFGEVPLHFVERHISRLIGEKHIADPLEEQRVQITESLELRNVSFEYLFFGGLTSSDFPRRKARDFLLPENLHARFREVDVTAESRYVFESAMGNTANRLYFSYPRMESGFEGEKLLEPSFILEDVMMDLGDSSEKETNPIKKILSKVELECEVSSLVKFGEPVKDPAFSVLLGKMGHPEKIKDMMRIEMKRASNIELSEFDGIVGPLENVLTEPLAGYYLPKVLSESGLGHFAKCPQHYFFQRLLHLEPLDEITEEVERSEFGSYVHEILEAFLNLWLEQNETSVRDDNFPKALACMLEVGERILRKQDKAIEYVLWDHKKERLLQGLDNIADDGRKGILRKFLEFEQLKSQTQFVPFEAERTFGFDQPMEIDGLRFRGKIDRIDILKIAGQENVRGFLFFDYKTGAVPSSKDICRGLNFQIPLYLWALKQKAPNAAVLGAFLNLQDNKDIQLHNVMGTPAQDDQDRLLGVLPTKKGDMRESSPWSDRLILSYAKKIHRNIERGLFHYAFSEVLCRSCNFKNVCRRNSERLLYLSQQSPDYYVPENNLSLYGALKAMAKNLDEMKQKIEDKKYKKVLKMGKSEILLPDKLHLAWTQIPKDWQEIFREEFYATLKEWELLLNQTQSGKDPA